MATTFEICKLSPAPGTLEERTLLQSVQGLLTPTARGDTYDQGPPKSSKKSDEGAIEACHNPTQKVISDTPYHPLFAGIHRAYMDHRPIVLSPDMIWLAIAQGTALHINNNAEAMRSKFVKHTGKATIIVRRDDFKKGGNNPWPEVFTAFSAGVMEHIGAETHQRFTAQFSTTGPVERAANEIVLMDTVKAYFEYILMTRCGIPSVTLEGTTDDWKQLAARVEALRDFIPDWWMKRLQPVCAGFIAASEGKADPNHWKNFYKWGTHSGGDHADGWITHLLPYIKDYKTGLPTRINPFQSSGFGGMSTDDIPAGLSACPFTWDYYGTKIPMNFLAGFVGATQDHQTLAIRPLIGWAVQEKAR